MTRARRGCAFGALRTDVCRGRTRAEMKDSLRRSAALTLEEWLSAGSRNRDSSVRPCKARGTRQLCATSDSNERLNRPLLTMERLRQPVAAHGNGFRLFSRFRGGSICRCCHPLHPRDSIKAPSSVIRIGYVAASRPVSCVGSRRAGQQLKGRWRASVFVVSRAKDLRPTPGGRPLVGGGLFDELRRELRVHMADAGVQAATIGVSPSGRSGMGG
jgi:hypothetical protein